MEAELEQGLTRHLPEEELELVLDVCDVFRLVVECDCHVHGAARGGVEGGRLTVCHYISINELIVVFDPTACSSFDGVTDRFI